MEFTQIRRVVGDTNVKNSSWPISSSFVYEKSNLRFSNELS